MVGILVLAENHLVPPFTLFDRVVVGLIAVGYLGLVALWQQHHQARDIETDVRTPAAFREIAVPAFTQAIVKVVEVGMQDLVAFVIVAALLVITQSVFLSTLSLW